MKVVVNATPLIAFAVLERLDLLREMFDEVIVPQSVCMANPEFGQVSLQLAQLLAADLGLVGQKLV